MNVVAPSLSGSVQDGQVLDVDSGAWSGAPTLVFTYQWQLSSDGGATWNDIGGATGTSYALPAGTFGKQVRAVVAASNADGSSQVASSASGAILAAPPVNTVAPNVTGVAQVGNTLVSSSGTWRGVPTLAYAYQWAVSVDGGLTWTDIAGATGPNLLLHGRSAGKRVRVVVTGTNPDGTAQAASPASGVVAPGLSAPSSSPPAATSTATQVPEPQSPAPQESAPPPIGTPTHRPVRPNPRQAKKTARKKPKRVKPKRRRTGGWIAVPSTRR